MISQFSQHLPLDFLTTGGIILHYISGTVRQLDHQVARLEIEWQPCLHYLPSPPVSLSPVSAKLLILLSQMFGNRLQ